MPSKYTTHDKRKEVVRPWKIHPVWRGIGFLMMVIVPIMAWIGAEELRKVLRTFRFGSFLNELPGNLTLPDIFYKIPGLSTLSNAITAVPNLPARLMLFVMLLLVISGFVSVLYALVYRMIGPSRYSPLDAPATRTKARSYKR